MNFYKNEIPPDYKDSLWLIIVIITSILTTLSIFWWFDIGFFEAF